jgi:lysine-specific demethylase 3
MRLKNDGARAMLDENIGSNNELNNEKTLSIIKGD